MVRLEPREEVAARVGVVVGLLEGEVRVEELPVKPGGRDATVVEDGREEEVGPFFLLEGKGATERRGHERDPLEVLDELGSAEVQCVRKGENDLVEVDPLDVRTRGPLWARERVEREGLSDRVEIRLVDYRDLPAEGKTYDRVVSIEMLEAVGYRYLPGYFETVDRLLAPEGIAVIQSITVPDDRHERLLRRPDFIQKHVFPGSHCPSVGAIASAVAARARLLIHRVEDVGAHYAETLRRCRAAFLANLPPVLEFCYDERFVRLLDFYLCYCEGGFATRHLGDVQLVLTPSGNRALGPVPGTTDQE